MERRSKRREYDNWREESREGRKERNMSWER